MVLISTFSLSHILIISLSWIVLWLLLFNRRIFKKSKKISPSKGESIVESGRFVVNVVYDSKQDINPKELCDLCLSFEKLAGGEYKMVESGELLSEGFREKNSGGEKAHGPFAGQPAMEDLSKYVDIKTIKIK